MPQESSHLGWRALQFCKQDQSGAIARDLQTKLSAKTGAGQADNQGGAQNEQVPT